MYILEVFTVQLADGTRNRSEEMYADIHKLRSALFWEKLKDNVVGHKIYQHIKHEDFLIESKWSVQGKKLWASSNATN